MQTFVPFPQCLVAELNMYEAQTEEYKGDMARMGNEMCELKKKYYTQKRKLQKMKEVTPRFTHESILPGIPLSSEKLCGGGFRIMAPTSKSCNILEASTSR